MDISGVNLSGVNIIDKFRVPNPPIIGTATAVSATSATVSFTAPAFNGNTGIISYTAVSSPGGITSTITQSGSGTITVTGLTPNTSYTFVVYATNGIGNSGNSSASNSITTPTTGQTQFVTPGTYSWTVPAGVTSVSVVCIGGSGGMRVNSGFKYSGGGGGGGLAYGNNLSVTPGEVISIQVGAGFNVNNTEAQPSWFRSTSYLFAGGGGTSTTGEGFGGLKYGGGGGGAGGYSGNGSNGGSSSTAGWPGGAGGTSSGTARSGGGNGGNGGQGGYGAPVAASAAPTGSGAGAGGNAGSSTDALGGGGVGILGRGSDGTANGGAGSGGTNGDYQIGGSYGGGTPGSPSGGGGAGGAIRIIWPGDLRQFPSTRTANE